jgi:hypothetical protein
MRQLPRFKTELDPRQEFEMIKRKHAFAKMSPEELQGVALALNNQVYILQNHTLDLLGVILGIPEGD